MTGPSQAAVTPQGVRDGDPGALEGLVARRGPAVLGYCREVCDDGDAVIATAEAFARFRAAVVAAENPAYLDPEVLLRGATRHAAAALARPAGTEHGLRALRRDRGRAALCAQVPVLLAARAEEMLGPRDLEALQSHLAEHPACQAVEEAFARAERSYANPPRRTLEPGVTAQVLDALLQAAPVAGVSEPESVPEFLEEPEPDVAPAEPAAAIVEAEPEAEPQPALPQPEPSADQAEPEPLDEPEPELLEEVTPEPDEQRSPEAATELAVAAPAEPVTTVLPAVTRSAGLPRTRRHLHLPHPHLAAHSPAYRLVLPASTIVVALIIILAIAGVFGGDGPSPA